MHWWLLVHSGQICSLRKDGTILEHLHHCSICDPTKIFLTSKFSYLLFFPTQSTAGATTRCSAFYQPQHPLGKKMLGQNHFGKPNQNPSCFDFSSSNFPLQGWWSCSSYLIFHLRKGWHLMAALTLFLSQKRTSVACAVGPSVTTSSADFSFQNLIFCGKFPKTPRTQFEASQFGGSHNYKTKETTFGQVMCKVPPKPGTKNVSWFILSFATWFCLSILSFQSTWNLLLHKM